MNTGKSDKRIKLEVVEAGERVSAIEMTAMERIESMKGDENEGIKYLYKAFYEMRKIAIKNGGLPYFNDHAVDRYFEAGMKKI